VSSISVSWSGIPGSPASWTPFPLLSSYKVTVISDAGTYPKNKCPPGPTLCSDVGENNTKSLSPDTVEGTGTLTDSFAGTCTEICPLSSVL